MKIVLILTNSADPDEMQHNAAFHLGLHCLPKDPLRGFQYTKSLNIGCENYKDLKDFLRVSIFLQYKASR